VQSPPVRDIPRVPSANSDVRNGECGPVGIAERAAPVSASNVQVNEHASSTRNPSLDGPALFAQKLRAAPLRACAGLVIEYGMFASGMFLALLMFVSRHPLGFVDRKLDLHLRERVIDFIARISPG
jgi:hypothetical protein